MFACESCCRVITPGLSLRGLFVIDDKGILRQITINDLPVGRSVDETLRLVQAFQFTDKNGEGEWEGDLQQCLSSVYLIISVSLLYLLAAESICIASVGAGEQELRPLAANYFQLQLSSLFFGVSVKTNLPGSSQQTRGV